MTKNNDFYSYWPEKFNQKAMREGWALFNAEGTLQIQRIDNPIDVAYELGIKKLRRTFKNDVEAYEFVASKAQIGNIYALALYLDGHNSESYIYIPTTMPNELSK